MPRIDRVYDETTETVLWLIDGQPILKMSLLEFSVLCQQDMYLLDKIRVNAMLRPYPVNSETESTIAELLRSLKKDDQPPCQEKV